MKKEGISVRLINIHTIKPFDGEIIKKAICETKGIVTVEDHNIIGGIGTAIAEVIAESGTGTKLRRIGLKDNFSKGYGTYMEVKENNGLGIQDIVKAVREIACAM